MALQYPGREIALQGGEPEATVSFALQAELHRTVAEPANSIVEKDWIGGAACPAQREASGFLCSSGTPSVMLPFSSK
jgi:hypothetical protein